MHIIDKYEKMVVVSYEEILHDYHIFLFVSL